MWPICPSFLRDCFAQLLLNMPEPPRVAEDAGMSWLSPLLALDEQDRATLMDGPDFIFADTGRCLVYCDLYEASSGMSRGRWGRGGVRTDITAFQVSLADALACRMCGNQEWFRGELWRAFKPVYGMPMVWCDQCDIG